jgi:hypothetical protein
MLTLGHISALGLKLNESKTKILSTPSGPIPCNLTANGQTIEEVKYFNYLGSIVNDRANMDEEITNRLNAASRSFWRLRERVFDSHDLTLSTKIAVYKAVVIPTMTYGCETWVNYRRHTKSLEKLQQRHLRQLLRIRWFHKISNAEVLRRSNCHSIDTILSRALLRWSGHVVRMNDNRLPKNILYGELTNGKRKQGGQRKRYKDNLHTVLKSVGRQSDWETTVTNRSEWRGVVAECQGTENIRRRGPTVGGEHPCPECGRICLSWIGLHSHMRWHQRNNT